MRITKGTVWWEVAEKEGREVDEEGTKATGGHRTRCDRVRLGSFKCDSCRQGK